MYPSFGFPSGRVGGGAPYYGTGPPHGPPQSFWGGGAPPRGSAARFPSLSASYGGGAYGPPPGFPGPFGQHPGSLYYGAPSYGPGVGAGVPVASFAGPSTFSPSSAPDQAAALKDANDGDAETAPETALGEPAPHGLPVVSRFIEDGILLPAAPARDTLKQVLVITRHGARFPLHSMPGDLTFPEDKRFWDLFEGYITPVGTGQMRAVGKLIRDRYIAPGLVGGGEPGSDLEAHTSATQRTIFSAHAFLMGAFPNEPLSFAVEEDGPERVNAAPGLVVRMSVTDEALLRQAKGETDYKKYTKKQKKIDHKLVEWSEDPAFQVLIDKAWDATGFHKLSPEAGSYLDRISGLKTIQTQIATEAAHGMRLVRNPDEIRFTLREREMIGMVSERTHLMKFQGATDDSREGGAMGGSHLMSHVVGHLEAKAADLTAADNEATGNAYGEAGRPEPSFVYYSAHDGTILGLMAHLGVLDIPIPMFGACVCFELHQSHADASFWVDVIYNPNPFEYSFDDLRPFRLPSRSGPCVAFDDLDLGHNTVEALVDAYGGVPPRPSTTE